MVSGNHLFVKQVFLDELQVNVLGVFILFCFCLLSICFLSITLISREGRGVESSLLEVPRGPKTYVLRDQEPHVGTSTVTSAMCTVPSTRGWIQLSRFLPPGRAVG